MNPRLKLLLYLLVAVCAISVCLNIFQGISKGSKAEGDVTEQLSAEQTKSKNLQDSIGKMWTLYEDLVKRHEKDSTDWANEKAMLQSVLDNIRNMAGGSQNTQKENEEATSAPQ